MAMTGSIESRPMEMPTTAPARIWQVNYPGPQASLTVLVTLKLLCTLLKLLCTLK